MFFFDPGPGGRDFPADAIFDKYTLFYNIIKKSLFYKKVDVLVHSKL